MSEGRRSQRIARQRDTEDAAPAKRAKVSTPQASRATSSQARTPAVPSHAPKTLAVGDALPDLALVDQDGTSVRVSELHNAVLFTYPRANTPGCTKQAEGYRDHAQAWKDTGYAVYGLSADAPKPLRSWASKLHLPFRLLSDPSRALIGALTGSKARTARGYVGQH